MAHERTDSYVKDSISLFQYYKKLGENAIAQCPDAGLFATLDEENNSIAIVVKHMVTHTSTTICSIRNGRPVKAPAKSGANGLDESRLPMRTPGLRLIPTGPWAAFRSYLWQATITICSGR